MTPAADALVFPPKNKFRRAAACLGRVGKFLWKDLCSKDYWLDSFVLWAVNNPHQTAMDAYTNGHLTAQQMMASRISGLGMNIFLGHLWMVGYNASKSIKSRPLRFVAVPTYLVTSGVAWCALMYAVGGVAKENMLRSIAWGTVSATLPAPLMAEATNIVKYCLVGSPEYRKKVPMLARRVLDNNHSPKFKRRLGIGILTAATLLGALSIGYRTKLGGTLLGRWGGGPPPVSAPSHT